MKKLVIAILLICMFSSPAWTLDDKAGHALAGAGIALQTALLMGVVKEISDSTNGGTVEAMDVVATFGGGLVVYFLRTQLGWELAW